MKKEQFTIFPIIAIILYTPFHLWEEYIGNYPLFLYTHYHLPKLLSYPHWLWNNGIFLATLIIGITIYLKDRKKNISFGFAIVIWAFINSIEHIVNSIIDMKLSPGSYSAFGFLFLFVITIMMIAKHKYVTKNELKKSIVIALSYWIIPIALILSSGLIILKYFPEYI
jgi:hypothetical protein